MTDNNQPIRKTTKRDRSTAYPAISLEDAVNYSEKLISAYPKSDFDREAAAKAIGYDSVSGASAPKIAALAHYGLLERKGSAYKCSDLAKRIHYFTSDADRNSAILEAVMSPALFNSLVSEYSNRAIPPTLNNVLISKYGISSKVADKAVQTFKDSVEYAGIYVNGVLKSNPDDETKVPKQEAVDADANSRVEEVEEPPIKSKSGSQVSGVHNVPLSNGVMVSYPANIAFKMQTNEDYIDALKGLEKVAKQAVSEENL